MTMDNDITARLWLRALGGIMMRVSRILIDNGTMKVKDIDPNVLSNTMGGAAAYETAPGWTDGRDVYLNAAVLVPKLAGMIGNGQHDAAVASVKGLVFHEDAHIVYSPDFRGISAVASTNHGHARRQPIMMAFNILEDQRIERLLVARFPHIRGYMVNLIMEWVLQDGTPSESAHALLYGRDYLSKSLRRLARTLFEAKHGGVVTSNVEKIITAFCKCQFPRDTNRAVALANALALILWPTPQDSDDGHGQHPSGEGIGDHPDGEQSGRQPDQKKQDEDGQKAGDVDDVDDDDADAPGPDDDVNVGPGTPGDDESDGEEVGDGGMGDDADADGADGGADADGAGDDADARGGPSGDDDQDGGDTDGDTDGDTTDGGGAASGGDPDDALKDAAQKELDALDDDAEYQSDLHDSMVDVRKSIGQAPHSGLEDVGIGRYLPAQGAPMIAAQHTRRMIRELQDYVAPGWERHMEGGRINPDDFLRRTPGTMDFFDQWNPGRERDASAEVIVMCDTSGSISGMDDAVSQAMWAIKSSMDSLKIPCTVMTFADKSRYVYRRTERTRPNTYRSLGAGGGTEPTGALDESIILMATSRAKSRLVFVITDGEFNNPTAAVPQFDMLRRIGVVTSYIGIGADGEKYGRKMNYYGCHAHGNVAGPLDIPPIVRQAVQTAIARKVMR